MASYYNENDPFAAAWLRELIKAGLIANGEVDERSITDVRPDDLRGFVQCHWFAGIGGWSYALRLAGWPDDRPAWTGSCPCQPWSVAGRNNGAEDSRDLWPTWFRLIRQQSPIVVFGEQVYSPDAVLWVDRAAERFECFGYAFGTIVLPAVGVGAPHQRDRFYFVADRSGAGPGGLVASLRWSPRPQAIGRTWAFERWNGGEASIRDVDDGLSLRMAKRIAHGFGNAIVPQVAQAFIEAYMSTVLTDPHAVPETEDAVR